MKEERVHHTNEEKEMLQKKKEQKQSYIGDEGTNIGDIESKENQLDQSYKELEQQLDLQRIELISKYDHKMQTLREELELRMKVEIHEIEERKN